MRYDKLLEAVKKLHAAQRRADKASENYHLARKQEASANRKAALSDKLVIECWERDKLLDLVHCELVNAGIAEPKDETAYAPREITQSAGHGHSVKFLYHPPRPESIQLSTPA